MGYLFSSLIGSVSRHCRLRWMHLLQGMPPSHFSLTLLQLAQLILVSSVHIGGYGVFLTPGQLSASHPGSPVGTCSVYCRTLRYRASTPKELVGWRICRPLLTTSSAYGIFESTSVGVTSYKTLAVMRYEGAMLLGGSTSSGLKILSRCRSQPPPEQPRCTFGKHNVTLYLKSHSIIFFLSTVT